MSKQRVPREYNGGTYTKAQMFGRIRSVLRQGFRYWAPFKLALDYAEDGKVGRAKAYRCAACGQRFKRVDVQVDHVEPCGTLRSFDDINGFVRRLLVEFSPGVTHQVLCKGCHQVKTNEERRRRGDAVS